MDRLRTILLCLSTVSIIALGVWKLPGSNLWRTMSGPSSSLSRANEQFAEAVLASASSDTPFHREVLSANQLSLLASQRPLLAGEPRRVLVDETWGEMEFGYCFASGAYAYITFLDEPAPPKPATLTVYQPSSPSAAICARR